MLEIAFLATDNTSTDYVKDKELPKLGDIIEWLPSGTHWGWAVINGDRFRVLRITGMTEVQAEAFKATELPDGTQTKILQYRQYTLNLSQLYLNHPELAKPRSTQWIDKNYKDWQPDAIIDISELLTLVTLKAPVSTLDVVGPSDNVIG